MYVPWIQLLDVSLQLLVRSEYIFNHFSKAIRCNMHLMLTDYK